MDRNKWAPTEQLQSVIFGFDLLTKTLSVFASDADAISLVEGLTIAEGDYRFFSADGAPMKATFSTPARIDPSSNTYSNGIYMLEPAAEGSNLFTLLQIVSCEDHAQSGLKTLRDVEQFLIDQKLRDVY
jgi:hypothetical protein